MHYEWFHDLIPFSQNSTFLPSPEFLHGIMEYSQRDNHNKYIVNIKYNNEEVYQDTNTNIDDTNSAFASTSIENTRKREQIMVSDMYHMNIASFIAVSCKLFLSHCNDFAGQYWHLNILISLEKKIRKFKIMLIRNLLIRNPWPMGSGCPFFLFKLFVENYPTY